MQRSVFVGCKDTAAATAARRMVGGGTGLCGPVTCAGDADLPHRAVLVETAAFGRGRLRAMPGLDTISVAIVDDHAAGLTAMRDGADHYILSADVDGPAADAVAIAIHRADRRARAGFQDGPIDNMHCIGSDAFRWLIQYTADVALRRGQIGYLILVHLVPDEPGSADAVAVAACTRLCDTTRSADIVSWLGRAWFGVLVSTSVSLEGAHALVARLADALRLPLEVDGRTVRVRCNLGLTTYGGTSEQADSILARATAAVDQSAWRYGAGSEEHGTDRVS